MGEPRRKVDDMSSGFLPRSDLGLQQWSATFLAGIQPAPIPLGLTAALVTAYQGYHNTYSTALAACDPAIRTKAATASKNQARANLKLDAKLLANIIEGQAGVTDAQKIALGLNVRAHPSPTPIPSDPPVIEVIKVTGWSVEARLHDVSTGKKRGKPNGVIGASLFSFTGESAPTDIAGWKFEGNTGKTLVTINFPSTLAAGTKVWISAFWFNGAKKSGPACPPVSTNLQGGSVAMAA